MESRAPYALVGVFVIFISMAILGFIIWKSGGDPNQEYDEYLISFDGPVRGIQEAAEVRFNGIKVGEVTSIRLDPDNTNKVLIRIQVFEETPVDIESYAQLEPMGLTGLTFVQLTAGGSDAALLKDQPNLREPYLIQGRGSQLDSLLQDGGSVVETVQKVLNSADRLLSPNAIGNVETTLANIADITSLYKDDPVSGARINATLDLIDQAALDVSNASIAVDETARDAQDILNNDVKPMLGRIEKTLDEIDATLATYRQVGTDASALLVNADGTMTRFEATTLQDLRLLMNELLALTESLNRISTELERNPGALLSGEDREYIKVPQ